VAADAGAARRAAGEGLTVEPEKTPSRARIVRIASDWHLAPRTPPGEARLAAFFLRVARLEGASVILNGDVFEDLFEGAGRSERAHPEVVAEIGVLREMGRLRRTSGNHDPASGEERIVLEWPGLGRVLVAHGDLADPVSRSWLGRLGYDISQRYGRLAVVRGAAVFAERAARAAAGRRIAAVFRARCLELVRNEGCDLGVFGHVHVPHLDAADRYANAGSLKREGLEYLELGQAGPRLCILTLDAIAAAHGGEERALPG